MTATTRPPKRTDPPRPKRPRQYVDATPIATHIHYLSQHGIGLRTIADLTGTSRSTIERIAGIRAGQRPPTRTVTHPIATAILNIQPSIDTASDGAFINPIGSTRRLQALVALGYPGRYLAHRLGADPKWLPIYRIPAHVRAASARAIRDLYDALSMRTPDEFPEIDRGAATRARNHAKTHGWPRPLEWDDDQIDNPAAVAERADRKPAPRGTRKHELLEDALWIIETTGADLNHKPNRDQIADRLGISIDYLDKILKMELAA